MKNSLIFLLVVSGLAACDSSPPPDAANPPTTRQPLTDAVKQPLGRARDAEKRVFESADQRKQQADEM